MISKEEVLESLENKLDDVERYRQVFSSVYTFELGEAEEIVVDKVLKWIDTYVNKLLEWERRVDAGEDPYKIYQEYSRFPDDPPLNEEEKIIYSNLNLRLIWQVLL